MLNFLRQQHWPELKTVVQRLADGETLRLLPLNRPMTVTMSSPQLLEVLDYVVPVQLYRMEIESYVRGNPWQLTEHPFYPVANPNPSLRVTRGAKIFPASFPYWEDRGLDHYVEISLDAANQQLALDLLADM